MSVTELVDGAGVVQAHVSLDPPAVESLDPDVAAWGTVGVPSLRGVIDGDVARHEEIVVPPTDPLWGLALLEEAERRGWRSAA